MEALVLHIMQLAYLVQTRTKFCAFISFSGHVNSVSISIRKSKTEWQTVMLESEFTTEYARLAKHGDPNALLNSKINVLKHILDTEEIPYEECDAEEICTTEYTF